MIGRRRDSFAVFAVAFVARGGVAIWAAHRIPPAGDGVYYVMLAKRLAAGLGYTWAWPDGTVTYAAHYPVGYPALVAAMFALSGGALIAAMLLNAVVGSIGAVAVHRLLLRATSPKRAFVGAILVALEPALVPYTAALMTEGIAAALLSVAAACAESARVAALERRHEHVAALERRHEHVAALERRHEHVAALERRHEHVAALERRHEHVAALERRHERNAARSRVRRRRLCCAAGVLGVATLVRPEVVLLAPVLGALAYPTRRFAGAACAVLVTLAAIAPWTARNCMHMHSCALVSVNVGWNLLIGTRTRTGTWEPLAPPEECRTVWNEAAKDACFARAALGDIARAPGAWLARIPSKLDGTFDYFGAAPWYLHASNPALFTAKDKFALGAVEVVTTRILLLVALLGAAFGKGRSARMRKAIALLTCPFALTLHATLAYLGLAACAALRAGATRAGVSLLAPWSAAVIVFTACVHAIFFGAGRYGLLVVPFVTALAATCGDLRRPRFNTLYVAASERRHT